MGANRRPMGLASKVLYFLSGVLIAVASSGAPVSADDNESRHEEAERASRGAESGELVPLAKIVAAVREQYGGEVVETEFEFERDRPYYEFYVLQKDGRLIEIKVDARTGRNVAEETDND